MTHIYVQDNKETYRVIGLRSYANGTMAITNDKRVVLLPDTLETLIKKGLYEGRKLVYKDNTLRVASREEIDTSMKLEWDKVYLLVLPNQAISERVDELGYVACKVYLNYLGNRASQALFIPKKLLSTIDTYGIIRYLANLHNSTSMTPEYYYEKNKLLEDKKVLKTLYKNGEDFGKVIKSLFNFEASNRLRELK